MIGTSINFSSKYSSDSVNVKLTDTIIKTLKENGYKIHIICSPSTEYKDGMGELTIYWD
jgi:hypothetical protein